MMMNRMMAAALAIPLTLAGCGTSATIANEADPIATTRNFLQDTTMTYSAPPRPVGDLRAAGIPAGQTLLVSLEHPFGGLNDAGRLGSAVTAHVLQPIEGRHLTIPQGAVLHGTVEGPIRPQQIDAVLAHVNFNALEVDGRVYPVATRIHSIDMAVTDDGSTMVWPGVVSAGDDEVRLPGAVLYDPEWQFAEFEMAPYPGSFISLGDSIDGYFPMGTRLEIELLDRPLMR